MELTICDDFKWLPVDEMLTALMAGDNDQLYIGGMADIANQTLTLIRGDRKTVYVPFSIFKPSGDGTVPDFKKLNFIDYGWTVVLGDYEAASDAII